MSTRPVDCRGASEAPLRILDAGCGRHLPKLELERALDLDRERSCHVTGIDVSQQALDLNETVDEKILGDLQTYPLTAGAFDVIVCWDVLEHLPRPELALENLARAVKPGGRIVIGMPNVLSPKGLATKLTPLRFHIWFYRRVLNYQEAGHPGFGPFKTYLRWSLRPRALARFAAGHRLEVEALEHQEPEAWKWLWAKYPRLLALATVVWKYAGAGADPRQSELRVVLVKPRSREPARTL